MSRSHLVPQSLGGFVWAWTHCADCNNRVGNEIEAAVKRDDSIRHALERELAREIPEIARSFAEGQRYMAPSETGNLNASFRDGAFALGTTRLEDSLVQDQARARESVETMLERAGLGEDERRAALERFDAAPHGELTQIADGMAVRHGSVETFVLPYDGEFVSDHFPLAIAFHLLAFFLGELIYNESLHPIRRAILEQSDDPEQFMVERLLDRSTGYLPLHVLGLSKPTSHFVLRVQIFGPLVWQVHLLRVRADRLTPMGMAIDVKEQTVGLAAPRAASTPPDPALARAFPACSRVRSCPRRPIAWLRERSTGTTCVAVRASRRARADSCP